MSVEHSTRFPEGIHSYCITGEMSQKERSTILKKVAKAPDRSLSIVHSCNTISEGIDTKEIEAVCFVDSKGSTIAITQVLGRITRLNSTKRPSRIFIPFFNVTDIPLGDVTNDTATLVNNSSYKTIAGVISLFYESNPILFDRAISNPKILTKDEYQFHFGTIISNANGTNYVGSRAELITDPGVVLCSSDIDGDVWITKTTSTNNYTYLYVNKEGFVEADLGSGPKPRGTKKPRKLFRVNGVGTIGDVITTMIQCDSRGEARREIALDFIEWIKINKSLPTREDPKYLYFFSSLQLAAASDDTEFSLEPDLMEIFTKTLKTKNWRGLTNHILSFHLEEFLDDTITTIVYNRHLESRYTLILKMLDYIIEMGDIPRTGTPYANIFNTVKGVLNGNDVTSDPLSLEELGAIKRAFKNPTLVGLIPTGYLIHKNIEKIRDNTVTFIDYKMPDVSEIVKDILTFFTESGKIFTGKSPLGDMFNRHRESRKKNDPLSPYHIDIPEGPYIEFFRNFKPKQWWEITPAAYKKGPVVISTTTSTTIDPTITITDGRTFQYSVRQYNRVVSFLNGGQDGKKLKSLLDKNGVTSKEKVYSITNDILLQISPSWRSLSPEDLLKLYRKSGVVLKSITETTYVDFIISRDETVSDIEEDYIETPQDLSDMFDFIDAVNKYTKSSISISKILQGRIGVLRHKKSKRLLDLLEFSGMAEKDLNFYLNEYC